MRRGRIVSIVAIVMVTASGCGHLHLARHGSSSTPGPQGSVSVGQGLHLGGATPGTSAAAAKASAAPPAPLFVLRVVDDHGQHPAGIPVKFSGAQNTTIESDANGEIKLYVPGVYTFAVVKGCHPAVDVLGAGGGTIGVAQGPVEHGDVQVIWKHRYSPAGPIDSDSDSDWHVGKKVTVKFTVADRCTENRTPNAAYPTFSFVPSSDLAIVDTPILRADGQGYGHVSVSCRRPGNVDLVARDRSDPYDQTNLTQYAIGFAGPARCVS